MADKKETACFTGHREIRPADSPIIRKWLQQQIEQLIEKGFTVFQAGGARGFDTIAAETVLQVKQIHKNIKLCLSLPFINPFEHEKGWTKEEIDDYLKVLKCADEVNYTQERYSSGVYYKRDRRLIDLSSICISYQYKNTGGTAYTTNYAQKNGVQVINFNR